MTSADMMGICPQCHEVMHEHPGVNWTGELCSACKRDPEGPWPATRPLKWTSERPSEPGWYWCLGRGGVPGVVEVVVGQRCQLRVRGDDYVRDLNRQWAGPLPLPAVSP